MIPKSVALSGMLPFMPLTVFSQGLLSFQIAVVTPTIVGRRVAARLPNWMMKTSGNHFKIR